MQHVWIPALLALAAAPAQSVVVPSTRATQEGNRADGQLFARTLGRCQWIFDGASLQPLPRITEVWFRRDMSVVRSMTGGTLDVEVWASETPAAWEGPSSSFARNHGPLPVRRFSGQVVFAPSPPSASVPALWDEVSGQAVRFVLQPPLTLSGTSNVCLEIVTRPVTGQTVPGWLVDAHSAPTPGAVLAFGQGCGVGGQLPRLTSRPEQLVPGSTAVLRLADAPAGRAALAVLGFSRTDWNGVPLPLALDGLGAPGCALHTAWAQTAARFTAVPIPGYPGAEAYHHFDIPLDRGLLAGQFFAQWLVFDPNANALGLVATHAIQAQLAAGFSDLRVGMVTSHQPTATEGEVTQRFSPVVRLVP